MSEVIPLYTKSLLESDKLGKKLYKNNSNYRTIANCMEDPEFRKLFDEHFSDVDRIKNILMFLKIYQEIENISPVELNGYQKISILDGIIKNRQLRREICSKVSSKTMNISEKLLN
jgi:hypothetical protein